MGVRKSSSSLPNGHLTTERQEAIAWMAEHEDIFGRQKAESEVQEELRKNPEFHREFKKLTDRLKTEFMEFCMGVRGMSVTYDAVFKKIYSPEEHPERLNELLSLCLGQKVEIVQVLPNESQRLTEESTLLMMDMLVKLGSGALVNVEIQRIGYMFPGQRCACYSSDLVMRQFAQVKSQKQAEGKRFSYKDIKNVYTIVLIQKSSSEFRALPNQYLHYSKQVFNTGLKLDMVQEYLLIPLDIFRKNNQNISNRLDGWLQFLASDSPEDIRRLLEVYPEFAELYREVFRFRYQMKELISMFSEELLILDANTAQYMIEVQQEEIERLKEQDQKWQEEIERQTKLARQAELEKQEAQRKRQEAEQGWQAAELAKREALAEVARLKALMKMDNE